MYNETWFLVEGLLWAAIGLSVLGRRPVRTAWAATVAAGVVVVTAVGLLSAYDVIGRVVVGVVSG